MVVGAIVKIVFAFTMEYPHVEIELTCVLEGQAAGWVALVNLGVWLRSVWVEDFMDLAMVDI